MVTCSNVELLGRFHESLSRVQEAVEQNAIVRFPRYALCQVDKFCVEHYCQVLRSLDESISRLRWEGRRSPSNGKVDYLLHVEDCLSCVQAFSVPDPWQGTDWPSDELAAWHRNLMEDQQYIVKQAARLREVSVTTRKAIQERLVTYSNYRITRVSVLAAVYIPLTFATGLFGMNIAEINGSIPEYWHVLAIGIPLTLLTVVGPLTIGPLTQFWLAGIKKERLRQFLWSAWFVATTILIVNGYLYGKNSNHYLGVVQEFFMTLILTASNIVTEGLLDVLIRLAFVLLQASCLILVIVASSLSPNLAEWALVSSTALWLVLVLYRGIVWLRANWQVKKLKQQ
ncbi:MAG: hypothetical protein M1830_001084 [Pleopsidium flavum]|nr:MAG: hypothetical protein M1830_001084 [Pleopsidium flavum]